MTSGPAALLSVHEVSLNYGQHLLLREATLAISAGEKIGLVGRNGCGKTSLLKIIAGQLQPDAGTLSRRRGLRTGYLPQEFEFSAARTVRENIAEGAADLVEWLRRYESSRGSDAELAELLHLIEAADAWTLPSRIRSIATALHAPDLESSTEALSGGEKRRVALCRALAGQPDLLLLDEPTNHLDAEAICWLQDFLRTFAGGVIFVTHDRYFLDLIATRIIELADGRCFSHPGNYTAYLESKAARQEIAEQSERRRQRFIRAELEFVRAGVRAQRSKSRLRLETFYQTAGLAAPPEEREMDLLIPPAAQMGNVGVDLTEVGAKVGDDAERWLFRGLNFSLRPGQCTGVIGRNGVGKTTLLRLCLGQREPDEGSVSIGKKVVFNYIDQERLQLGGTGSVIAEVEDTDDIVYFGDQKISARSYLRRFLFSDERVNERVDRLSGGERARLLLAKVLKRGGNFLVLDEPTNDLDLASLRMLEEALIHFDGAVLVVSHDRFFLDRICDQVIAFENDAVFVQPGNYSYYMEKKAARQERESKPPASAPPTQPAPGNRGNRNRPRKLSFKEQRELDSIEQTILDSERRIAEFEATLNDPAFYVARAGEAPKVIAELQTAREEVSRLYARWGDLEQIRG